MSYRVATTIVLNAETNPCFWNKLPDFCPPTVNRQLGDFDKNEGEKSPSFSTLLSDYCSWVAFSSKMARNSSLWIVSFSKSLFATASSSARWVRKSASQRP